MNDENKRSEPRIRSKGVLTLMADGAGPVEASILDVSPSGLGLGLEAAAGFTIGTPVEIHGAWLTASGVVRFSHQRGQTFRLGIELIPVED